MRKQRNDRTLPWISNMDLILINPVPLSNPLQKFFLYKCMQMCHFFKNRTTAPSNACNFGSRYRMMIFHEVSNCAELRDAFMDIKHLP